MKLFLSNVLFATMATLAVATDKQEPVVKRSLSKHDKHAVSSSIPVQHNGGSKHAVSSSKTVHHNTEPQKTVHHNTEPQKTSHTPQLDINADIVECLNEYQYSVFVEWAPDDNILETSWGLEDEFGVEVAYNQFAGCGNSCSLTICLNYDVVYTMTVYDTYGDGLSATGLGSTPYFYADAYDLDYSLGEILSVNEDCEQYCLNFGQSIDISFQFTYDDYYYHFEEGVLSTTP